MKHLKKYNEGFLDYFKKDSPDDKLTLDVIKRISQSKEDYEIVEIVSDGKGKGVNLPKWLTNKPQSNTKGRSDTYSKVYLIKFDDMEIIITNDRNNLPKSSEFSEVLNKWKMFISLQIGGESEFGQRVNSKESYRKKLFNLVDDKYKKANGEKNNPKKTVKNKDTEGEEWKKEKQFRYKDLSKSELDVLINQALDTRDFKRVKFLSQFLKESLKSKINQNIKI